VLHAETQSCCPACPELFATSQVPACREAAEFILHPARPSLALSRGCREGLNIGSGSRPWPPRPRQPIEATSRPRSRPELCRSPHVPYPEAGLRAFSEIQACALLQDSAMPMPPCRQAAWAPAKFGSSRKQNHCTPGKRIWYLHALADEDFLPFQHLGPLLFRDRSVHSAVRPPNL